MKPTLPILLTLALCGCKEKDYIELEVPLVFSVESTNGPESMHSEWVDGEGWRITVSNATRFYIHGTEKVRFKKTELKAWTPSK